MAKKKRKKARSAAQRAATAKLVAGNKSRRKNPRKRTKRKNPKRRAARRRHVNPQGASMAKRRRRSSKRRSNPANPARRRRRHNPSAKRRTSRRRRNPKFNVMQAIKPALYGGAAAVAGLAGAFALSRAPLRTKTTIILANVAAGLVLGAAVGMLNPAAGAIAAAPFFGVAGQYVLAGGSSGGQVAKSPSQMSGLEQAYLNGLEQGDPMNGLEQGDPMQGIDELQGVDDDGDYI